MIAVAPRSTSPNFASAPICWPPWLGPLSRPALPTRSGSATADPEVASRRASAKNPSTGARSPSRSLEPPQSSRAVPTSLGSRHPRRDLLGPPQVSSGDSKGRIRDVVGEYALDGGQGATKLDRCKGFVGLAAWSARLHMPGQSNALITCSVATASKASDQRGSGKSVASLSTCGPMLRSRCRAWSQVG